MKLIRVLLVLAFSASLFAQDSDRPKVRAITAFVRLTTSGVDAQLADALKFLQTAKATYEKRGYEVQTIRVTTEPFAEYVRGLSPSDALQFLQKIDSWAQQNSVDPNIGPILISDSDFTSSVELLKQVLTKTKLLEGSIIVADKEGIHWKAIRASAEIVKYAEENSPHSQGTFNFTATAMLEPYGPFFPGSYHLGPGGEFAIGLQGANIVQRVFASATMQDASDRLAAELGKYATECEDIAREAAQATGWKYKGMDPTPAPLAGVSIGAAIESLTKSKFGSSGTMTAAAAITRAVKAVPVQHVGYSGLMVPVLEDALLAQRWSEGTFNVDDVLAYSAVCGTGLDTIPLPGDVTVDQLSAMIGDMASLAWKWKKPLSARLQPVLGKKAGEKTDFDDPFLTNATLQRLP
jgi:uncharacterized protein (UPF0210 family)